MVVATPSAVHRAEQRVGGHPDVVEEDLGEIGRAGEGDERANLDAGRHMSTIRQEMPLCLGASGSVRTYS